jgi:mitochondrial fission protein ELM1
VSLAIKTASAGKTIAVHIGRPRMNLDRFDLVLTTPQYGLPPGPNVVVLTLPFAVARDVSAKVQSHFGEVWGHLPRPWLVGVIGAAKFPIRFGPSEIGAFAKAADGLAHSLKGSLILMDSPRSPPGAIADVAARVTAPHWMWTRGQGDNPYQAALKMGDCFAVTSDSASMMAEMVRTRRPTYVHRLPVSPITPVWRAQSGLPALLARRGILSPPRDVGRFVDHLSAQGWIGNLQSGAGPQSTFAASDEHDAAIERILTLWRGHAAD